MELAGARAEYESQSPEGGLLGFLENVALVTDLDSMGERPEAVTLMTIHASKGLEFPHVIVTGMEETVFPLGRATFEDGLMEEERRLCYVAFTPAHAVARAHVRGFAHAVQPAQEQPALALFERDSRAADRG